MSVEDATKSSEQSGKRRWPLLIISLVIIISLGLVWFNFIGPRSDIANLQKGFVQVSYKDGEVSYTVSKKRPSHWVSLKEMNHTAAHAIVVSEDWAFYQHSGYDLNQIKSAFSEAVKGGRKRGASTITQQLIKNLFLTPEKSATRKAKELLYSTYLEKDVSKEKILETYLNIVEFGKGIYGIKAASQHYFKKLPKDLSAKEGAFLAMLLPNPKRYSESFSKKELTPFAKKTVNEILEKMVQAKYLDSSQLESSKSSRFSWEGKSPVESQAEQQVERRAKHQAASKVKDKRPKLRKKRKKRGKRAAPSVNSVDGSDYERARLVDDELELEENPSFDEDALQDDTSGLETEFNAE